MLFVLAVGAYLAHLGWHRRLPGPTRLDWPIVGIVAAYTLAIGFSVYPRFSIEAAFLIGAVVFTFYLFSDFDELTPPAIVRGLAGIGIAGAVLALVQVGEDYVQHLELVAAVEGGFGLGDVLPPSVPRVHDVGDHVNLLAMALNLTLPFALLLALQGRRVERWIGAPGACAILLALFFTVSRGAWLSAALALPLLAVLYARRESGLPALQTLRLPRSVMAGGLAVCALAAIAGGAVVATRWDSRPEWLFRSSLSPRYDANKVGLRIARDEPLTGAGPNTYSLLYNVYSGDYPIENIHPHNGYIGVLVDAGILGAMTVAAAGIVLIASLLQTYRSGSPQRRAIAAACIAALASVAVHAFFDLPNLSKTAMLTLAVVAALSLKIGRRPPGPARFLSLANLPRLAILAFVPLVLAGWLWTDRGHAAYDDSLAALAKGEFDAAVRQALEAAEDDPDFAAYHFHAGVMQAISYFVHNDRGDPLPRMLDGAVASLRRGLDLEPRSGIGHVNLALALQVKGDLDGAVEHAHIAMERAPGDGTIAAVAGTIFEWADRRGDAVNAYAWAVTHDPGLIESSFWTTNDFRRQARAEVVGKTFLNDCQKARVVGLYNRYVDDDLASLAAGCSRVLANAPSDARARSDLAIALYRTGAQEEARTEARRAVDQAPDNAYARTALGFVLMDADTAKDAKRELALGAHLGDPDAVLLLNMFYESSFLSPDEDAPEEVLDLLEAALPGSAPFVFEGGRQQYLLGILYYRVRYYRESPLAILIPSGPDGWLAFSSVRSESIERALQIAGRRP